MAVPKKKMSRMRTRRRKAEWKLHKPRLSTCPQCHAPKQPHRSVATAASTAVARSSTPRPEPEPEPRSAD